MIVSLCSTLTPLVTTVYSRESSSKVYSLGSCYALEVTRASARGVVRGDGALTRGRDSLAYQGFELLGWEAEGGLPDFLDKAVEDLSVGLCRGQTAHDAEEIEELAGLKGLYLHFGGSKGEEV